MRSETQPLKARMRATNDLFERLEILRNRYSGQTAYIVSCGPSLSSYDPDRLREFLSDKLVFAVKQAYGLVSRQTDFHILHHSNIQRYRYPADGPIVVNEDEGHSFVQPDLLLPKDASDLYRSISLTREFAQHQLDRNPIRPCGPGILYEVAFYLALHLGVANAVVLGWDLYSDPVQLRQVLEGGVEHTHFYDGGRGFAALARPDLEAGSLAERLEKFRQGEIINTRLHIPADDIVLTALGSRPLADWLASQGMRLFTTTDSPNVSRAIPRLELFRADAGEYRNGEWRRQRAELPDEEFPQFRQLKKAVLEIGAADPRLTNGWWDLENWAGRLVRWSGPATSAVIPLPLDRSRDLRIRFTVAGAFHGNLPELWENGKPVALRWSKHAGDDVAEGVLAAGSGWTEVFSLLEFRCREVFRPVDVIAGSADRRKLGFAFASLQVEPAST